MREPVARGAFNAFEHITLLHTQDPSQPQPRAGSAVPTISPTNDAALAVHATASDTLALEPIQDQPAESRYESMRVHASRVKEGSRGRRPQRPHPHRADESLSDAPPTTPPATHAAQSVLPHREDWRPARQRAQMTTRSATSSAEDKLWHGPARRDQPGRFEPVTDDAEPVSSVESSGPAALLRRSADPTRTAVPCW